ncbi:MAG: hypothetical protein ACJA13_001032, partial [Paraglaciecola sp.]
KLPVQYILKQRFIMFTVRGYLIWLTTAYRHFRCLHQLPRLSPIDRVAQAIQRPLHSATGVTKVARLSNTHHPLKHFCPYWVVRPGSFSMRKVIKTASLYVQQSAHGTHWPGLLPLRNKCVFYFVSLAKKTVASFNISFSISRRLTCALRVRISSCSGVSLPLPRKAWPSSSFNLMIISNRKIIRQVYVYCVYLTNESSIC